jgi:hypothetical protein
MTYREPARTTTRRIRIRRIRVAGLLVVIAAIAAALGYRSLAASSSTAASPIVVLRGEHRGVPGEALPSTVWPAYGQAAVQIGQSQIQAGPNQHVAAIASVAKVMTAYLVLCDHPLALGEDGPTITLTDADVADTDLRREQQESVVSISAGEQLTERQLGSQPCHHRLRAEAIDHGCVSMCADPRGGRGCSSDQLARASRRRQSNQQTGEKI